MDPLEIVTGDGPVCTDGVCLPPVADEAEQVAAGNADLDA